MNFWQRRPIRQNLIGLLLVALVWLLLELALGAVLNAAGFGGLARQRGSLIPVLIASLVVVRCYDRMPIAWLGLALHRWFVRELALGTLFGLAMASLAWAPGALMGSVETASTTTAGIFVQAFMYIAIGAGLEELIFRGYVFQRLAEIAGPIAATIIASTLFAFAHVANPAVTPIALANIFLGSVFFSLGYFVTGSLWFPIAAHAAWNLALALILGVPVSGIDFSAGWLRTIDGAPAIVGGGAFGPEGGLAGTFALAIGIALLVRSRLVEISPYVHARVFAAVYESESRRLANRSGIL